MPWKKEDDHGEGWRGRTKTQDVEFFPSSFLGPKRGGIGSDSSRRDIDPASTPDYSKRGRRVSLASAQDDESASSKEEGGRGDGRNENEQ